MCDIVTPPDDLGDLCQIDIPVSVNGRVTHADWYLDSKKTATGEIIQCSHGAEWEDLEEPEEGKTIHVPAGSYLRVKSDYE